MEPIGHEKILTETIEKVYIYHQEIKITVIFKVNI